MAQLAISIAGGLVGSLFGFPQLGFLAGSLLGQLLFPSNSGGGGRLTDLKVTSSTYGSPIPIIYGTQRIGGNIIWAHPIKEHKQGSLGKGLGPTSYTYSWTGAIAVGEGPILDITRIWADTKLVYDKTGETSQTTLNKYKLKFRLYKGSETQMPDSALEALVGADNATAHRGMAYIVFDDIPLQDYGNRIPNFTFEVVASAQTHQEQMQNFVFSSDGAVHAPSNDRAWIDWESNRSFHVAGQTPDGVYTQNISTGQTMFFSTRENMFEAFPGSGSLNDSFAIALGRDGFVYIVPSNGNTSPIYKLNADSLKAISVFGTSGSGTSNERTGFQAVTKMVPLQVGGINYMATVGQFASVGVFCTDTMSVSAPDTSSNTNFSFDVDEGHANITGGDVVGSDSATFFVMGQPNFGPDHTLSWKVYKATVSSTGALSHSVIGTYDYSDINPRWSGVTQVFGPVYDHSDGNVIFGVRSNDSLSSLDIGDATNYIVKVSTLTGDILWKSPVNEINYGSEMAQSTINNGTFAVMGNHDETTKGQGDAGISGECAVYLIDLNSGLSSKSFWSSISTGVGYMVFDDTTGGALVFGTVNSVGGWHVIYPDRSRGQGATLDSVVTDLCSRVGLVDADIDVTALEPFTVDGYVIGAQQSVRDSIMPLATSYLFDGVESDDKIKFILRGGSSAVSVPKTDLAVIDTKTNALSQETRTQEVDLPVQISVQFFDPTHDYQQATQYMRRTFAPVATMQSRNSMSVNLPLVMEADDAKQVAEKILFTSWIERVGYKLKLPWQYLKYDPTDIMTVSLSDDTTVLMRNVQMDVGADLSIEANTVSESTATYSSTATGASGDGFPQQVIKGAQTSKLFLLDTPLLRDVDDTGQSYTFLYFAGSGYSDGWPGLELYKSLDGGSYDDAGGIATATPWGAMLNTLGDTSHPFSPDYDNTITVSMFSGADQIASATLLGVCNGANAAAILDPVTGIAEVIQFQTATQNADDTFTLSGLLRGRRGTEPYTGSHGPGEVFVLLLPADMRKASMSLADLNAARFFKGVTAGTLLENASQVNFTDTGRTLKPYAPVHQSAVIVGSDIVLHWVRRTRIGGEMQDGTGDVPLSETSEKYEVDIYDAMGTTVLRTLTADYGAGLASDPSVTYTTDDIIADFGGSPTFLTIAVYQISGAIGRGFTEKVTIPVSGTAIATTRYFGAASATSLDEAGVLALSDTDHAPNFDLTFSYDCTGSKYPYFAYPEAFGVPAAVQVNGLPFSDFSVSVVSVGGTNYNVLRFNNIQTGSAIPTVWA